MKLRVNQPHFTLLTVFAPLLVGATLTPALAQGNYNTVPVPGIHAPGLSGSSRKIGPNIDVNDEPGPQSETSVAVDPTNANHLLYSANDLNALSGAAAVVWESTDGGATFTSFDQNPNNFCYDTWLAFNANGDAFMSYLCHYNHNLAYDQNLAYKKKGETTWTSTVISIAGAIPDRDMVIVDNAANSPFKGSVYIGYDDGGEIPYVLYSRNGFGSWLRSTGLSASSAVVGVNLATGPDGTVYAAWEDWPLQQLVISTSADGGASFGTPVLVTNYRIDTRGFWIFIPPQNIRGIVPMPFIAVAQAGAHAGRVYVSYTDQDTSGSNTNIYIRHSDDSGTTWSMETKVNDDTNHAYHFHNAISVLYAGVPGAVGLSFYDTRRDPNNQKTDRYFTYSLDGGVTWAKNIRITTEQSDETLPGSDPNQYGDYQGMDFDPSAGMHLSWTDSRPTAMHEDVFAGSVHH